MFNVQIEFETGGSTARCDEVSNARRMLHARPCEAVCDMVANESTLAWMRAQELMVNFRR